VRMGEGGGRGDLGTKNLWNLKVEFNGQCLVPIVLKKKKKPFKWGRGQPVWRQEKNGDFWGGEEEKKSHW